MYTLKCTYSVGAVPEGHDASIERSCVQALAVGESKTKARKRRPNRPTNIELAFYIFNVSRTDTVLSYM